MHDLIASGILWPCIAIMFLAGTVQGAAGLGLALVGVPLLTFYVVPDVSVPIVTLLTVPCSAVMLIQFHDHIYWPGVFWAGIPVVLFAPIGVQMLKVFSGSSICVGIGVVLIFSALYSWTRDWMKARAAAAAAAGPDAPTAANDSTQAAPSARVRGELVSIGAVSGVLGGAVGMNGPLLADYLNKGGCKPAALKVTLNMIFLVSAVTRVGLYFAQGVMKEQSLWLALCGAPAAALATWLGIHFTKKMRAETFAKVMNGYLLGIGVWMLYQGFRQ